MSILEKLEVVSEGNNNNTNFNKNNLTRNIYRKLLSKMKHSKEPNYPFQKYTITFVHAMHNLRRQVFYKTTPIVQSNISLLVSRTLKYIKAKSSKRLRLFNVQWNSKITSYFLNIVLHLSTYLCFFKLYNRTFYTRIDTS